MFFLGMQRRPKTALEKASDPLTRMRTIQDERRQSRMKFMDDFKSAREVKKEDILADEGEDIMEQMKKERRDWIQDYKQQHASKPPEDIKKFYDRLKTEIPLSPEEEEAKRLQEEEDAKSKGKGKKKEAKKKGKSKKGGGDDDDKKAIVKVGPSEVVQKFDEFFEDFNQVWAARDESDNP